MPKNHKPRGGRPAANFEPRYAKKTPFHDRHTGGARRDDRSARDGGGRDGAGREGAGRDGAGRYERADARPGSRSPKHRGYRPADDAPKRRWSAQEKAGRDEARGIRGRAESGRVDAPHRRDDRFGREDRRTERPRFDRDRRDDRTRFERDDRRSGADRRAERPRFERDDRARQDRPRYERDDRARFDRDDRNRQDRPRNDRDDRRSERPRFDRDDRNRQDRPRHERDDRRSDRPRFERDDRNRQDRTRFERDDRRPERPRYDRPQRDDRFGRGDRRADRPSRPGRETRPSRDDWHRTSAPAAAPIEDVVHERLQAQAVQAAEVADVSFADLGLGSNIAETLANMGAQTPFPIQAATIPAILEGRDVLGRGRTGSGKTIAFGAPLVESILKSQAGKKREFGRSPRAIILAPTRELALQIDRTVQPIARSVGLFTTQIYGGVPQARQVGALKKGVDIVIGTPGRIEDLIEQGKLDLSDARIAVLDEADHMCELGFVEPVQRILRATGTGLPDGTASQKLLFSATLDREVASLVDEFLVDPAVYEVAGEDQDSSSIEHRVLVIDHRDKADILTSLVDREGKTLVFSRTRAYAEMLAEQFEDAGIPTVALHGDLNQGRRTRNLARMTSGKVNVLVATDVAARGIHVDDIDLVVQADAPDEYKTYLHRSGRTGRAGRAGRVVTLITRQRRRRMTELLDRAEIEAPFDEARAGDDVVEEIAGRLPSDADLTA
ncbi:DEAD/DEAH box helicase [Microbacterium pseudoresistens]|uniref:Superfamily II DNA/RNA helicase n=1 Tax=Microbacterium pseudoresistens TaxID=640634 RepID=A0A7Y9ETQ5_9MICO|nr:DEAD/DEAH box helicase [Microbacterium pseudoresistens]NYD53787.1 superfamily II DNA/RNA helicase [Microbacterium pseudoresistens]